MIATTFIDSVADSCLEVHLLIITIQLSLLWSQKCLADKLHSWDFYTLNYMHVAVELIQFMFPCTSSSCGRFQRPFGEQLSLMLQVLSHLRS